MRVISDSSLAAITIWQEARGESFEGKVAVGEVIRTRIRRKVFSDGTVAGTVLWPYQFSGFNTKDPNRIASFKLDDSDPQYQACLRAWEFSRDSNLTLGATHYCNLEIVNPRPIWATPEALTCVIGHHSFYLVP